VLPEVNPPKKDTIFSNVRQSPVEQRPVAVSLGPHVKNIAQPKPDLDDTATMMAGVVKRVASRHPDWDRKTMRRFQRYVRKWVKRNLVPLASDIDVTFDTWIEKTPYPKWRKDELKLKHSKIEDPYEKRWKKLKCFPKDENYPAYKHTRGIYSRTDEFKTLIGPYIKVVEEEVYKLPQFIKHIPVADRPQYIKDYLAGEGACFATDYTAYESQFRRLLMESTTGILFDHMLRHTPGYKHFMKLYSTVMDRQQCIFKYFNLEMDTCRASGEMDTSLSNGFANLMFASFIAHEKGIKDLKIVIEGDDGLFRAFAKFTADDFAKLGLTIKIEEHDKIETASFCGIVFDSEELINITNPLGVLVDFGWGDRKYLRAKLHKKKVLLRCKALSLAHQYPGCPIIFELAKYGLRVTSDIKNNAIAAYLERSHINLWDRQQLQEAYMCYKDTKKIKELIPGPRSRALVEELYGVSLATQLQIESRLRNFTELQPLDFPGLLQICPDDWNNYAEQFGRRMLVSQMDYQVLPTDGVDHVSRILDLCQ